MGLREPAAKVVREEWQAAEREADADGVREWLRGLLIALLIPLCWVAVGGTERSKEELSGTACNSVFQATAATVDLM